LVSINDASGLSNQNVLHYHLSFKSSELILRFLKGVKRMNLPFSNEFILKKELCEKQ
jgi:hypothetical protein